MNERTIPVTLEELAEKLQQLERRVVALEGESRLGDFLTAPTAHLTGLKDQKNQIDQDDTAVVRPPDALVPVIGQAVLGIAGAYLLRSAAESGWLPFAPAIATLYAIAWLALAVRPRQSSFGSIAFSLTAVLIALPMLWETTTRFRVVSPTLAAIALLVFTLAGLALAWPRNLQTVAWIVMLPALGTALVLLIATRELAPFTSALLAMAVAAEFCAWMGRWPGLRVATALVANLAVLNLVVSSGGSGNFAAAALLAICGGSALLHLAVFRGVSWFELWQPLIALWLLIRDPTAMSVVLSVAAVAATWAARSLGTALKIHSMAFLLLAGLLAGLPQFAFGALVTPAIAAGLGIWIVCAAAAACYFADRSVLAASIAALATVSLAARAIVLALDAGPSWSAVIRTVIICGSAAAVAYSGFRWRRADLVWVARGAMVVAALKLIADDFRHARAGAVAVSLLCFGAALILMPRWTRWESLIREPAPSDPPSCVP